MYIAPAKKTNHICVLKVGTDESQESSMTDADDTQLHAVESDEF